MIIIVYLMISVLTSCIAIKIDPSFEDDIIGLGFIGLLWFGVIPMYLIGFIGNKLNKLFKKN